MAPIEKLNAQEKSFEELIETFGSEIGWEFDEIDADHAVVSFEMDSGRTEVLYISNNDDLVEFDIPTVAQYDTEDDIPDEISTLLLKRNSLLNYGLWTIEQIEDKFYFSLMYNEELKILRSRTAEEFSAIVDILLNECDEVEGSWLESEGE